MALEKVGDLLQRLVALRDLRVVLRSTFIASGILCILIAVKTEPIANVFGASRPLAKASKSEPVAEKKTKAVQEAEKKKRQKAALESLGEAGWGSTISLLNLFGGGGWYRTIVRARIRHECKVVGKCTDVGLGRMLGCGWTK